jgi:hypothetical protein
MADIPRSFISKYKFNKVARSFGDIDAKLEDLGGNSKVLIAVPDIVSFKIKEDTDFIVLGCDGIFDKLTNKDIVECVWASLHPDVISNDINEQSGKIIDLIIKSSMVNYSMDNLTCIFISFENFSKIIYNKDNPDIYNKMATRISHIRNENITVMEPMDVNSAKYFQTDINDPFGEDGGMRSRKNTSKNFNNLYTSTNSSSNLNYSSKPLFKINPKIGSYDNNLTTLTTTTTPNNGKIFKNGSLPNIYQEIINNKKNLK